MNTVLASRSAAVGPAEPTLERLVPRFLAWFALVRNKAPNTVKSYGEDLRTFTEFCRGSEIIFPRQVNFQVVEVYLAWIRNKRGLAASTVNRHLHALRALWRYLEREDLTTGNPAAQVFPLRVNRELANYISIPEQEKILRELSRGKTLRGRRDFAIIATGLLAGLRVSELVNLKVEHVNLATATLRVVHGKGGRSRELPMVRRLAEILESYMREVRPAILDQQREESRGNLSFFVRTRPPGNRSEKKRACDPLERRTVYKLVRNRVGAVLGRSVSPHVLRHSLASRIREQNGDLLLIKEILGHASLNTTEIYAHITPAKTRRDLERLLS